MKEPNESNNFIITATLLLFHTFIAICLLLMFTARRRRLRRWHLEFDNKAEVDCEIPDVSMQCQHMKNDRFEYDEWITITICVTLRSRSELESHQHLKHPQKTRKKMNVAFLLLLRVETTHHFYDRWKAMIKYAEKAHHSIEMRRKKVNTNIYCVGELN